MEKVDFQWWRCADGYRLERTQAPAWPLPQKLMAAKYFGPNEAFTLTSASDRFEQYAPPSGLFSTFAETPPTVEGMLGFANRYGLLGGARPDLAERPRQPVVDTAPVSLLLEHHQEFRRALELFQCGDKSELIIHCNSTHWPATVRTELRLGTDGRIEMVFAPPGLLQAMWLQFISTVCAEAQIFHCERCGKPFTVGTGTGRRGTSKWCSNACKVAAYQKKRREANA